MNNVTEQVANNLLEQIVEIGPDTLLKIVDAVRRGSTALEAIKIVYGDRRESYGDAIDNHERIAKVMNAIKDMEDSNVYTAKGVALVLLSVKLARRQLHYKPDTMIDVVGYAEIIERFEKRAYDARNATGFTAPSTRQIPEPANDPTSTRHKAKARKTRMPVSNKRQHRKQSR